MESERHRKDIGAEEKKKPSTLVRVLQAVFSVVLVAAIFLFLIPRIANYSEVWATISDMTWIEIATLLLATAWNFVTYWFVLIAVLPGLRMREAAVSNQASTAVANTIPAGGAIAVGVTYAMYTSWGFTKADFALAVLLSGIWNNFMKLGLPVVALALLAVTAGAGGGLVAASLVGVLVLVAAIVLFGLMLWSDRLAAAIGGGLGRAVSWIKQLFRKSPVTDWADRAREFRDQSIGLLRTRWYWITLATLVSHLSLYFVLLLTLRHVGVSEDEVSWIEVLAAFAFVRLLSALPITPGGVGVVELGYAAILGAGQAQITKDQIVAAVLVFRALTFFLPIPFGAASYVFWRHNRSWRKTPAERQHLNIPQDEASDLEAEIDREAFRLPPR